MPNFSQKKLKESRDGTRNLFSFGFKRTEPSSPGGPPTPGGASGSLQVNSPNKNFATSSRKDQSQESDDDVQQSTPASSSSNGKRKLGSLDPINKGPAVDHVPLEPHQAAVYERMKAGMAHNSFAANRVKLGEIAREAAKARGMGDETPTDDVLREACREYAPKQVLALDQLRERPLTPAEMLESGVQKFDWHKNYGGQINYMHYYVFWSKQPALDMTDKWQFEMGVGASLCGALRAKVNRHDWNSGEPLRLGISGEGLPGSAHKYANMLQEPPTEARARKPRQVNGRVANDGPAWNVPAGLVLAGAGAISTVGTETYVWKTGDSDRALREVHEAIGAVVFLGGLVWSPESLGLNQKVGGTFTDEQRSRGGRNGLTEEEWAHPSTGEQVEKKKKRIEDNSRAGAATSGVDCNQVGAGKNSNNAARLRLDIPGATKARGLCLGLDAQGDALAEKLATWIDTDTGAIREGAPLCGRPKFGKDGYLTRGKGEWKQDGKGYLVLGVHNGNGKPTNPWCGIGGTVPVVLVGGEWRVAKWGLPFIKARKVVQRNTDNQRHGRVPK